MPTNDPHPTAQALVEAPVLETARDWLPDHVFGWTLLASCQQQEMVVDLAALLHAVQTAAHDAGRREGREEAIGTLLPGCHCMLQNASARPGRHQPACPIAVADAIRALPLDDAARGEEPKP